MLEQCELHAIESTLQAAKAAEYFTFQLDIWAIPLVKSCGLARVDFGEHSYKFMYWKSQVWPTHVRLKVLGVIMIGVVSFFKPVLPWSMQHLGFNTERSLGVLGSCDYTRADG